MSWGGPAEEDEEVGVGGEGEGPSHRGAAWNGWRSRRSGPKKTCGGSEQCHIIAGPPSATLDTLWAAALPSSTPSTPPLNQSILPHLSTAPAQHSLVFFFFFLTEPIGQQSCSEFTHSASDSVTMCWQVEAYTMHNLEWVTGYSRQSWVSIQSTSHHCLPCQRDTFFDLCYLFLPYIRGEQTFWLMGQLFAKFQEKKAFQQKFHRIQPVFYYLFTINIGFLHVLQARLKRLTSCMLTSTMLA